jgi:hypothetical protein
MTAVDLGAYSFLAPFVSFAQLLPSGVLLPAWVVLVGRRLDEREASTSQTASAGADSSERTVTPDVGPDEPRLIR